MKRILAVLAALWISGPALAEVELDATRRAELAGLETLRGAPLDMRDNVVVVAFFASWCPPCHEEFGHLERVHLAYPGIEVAAVNVFEDWGGFADPHRLGAFLARHNPSFTVLTGTERTRARFGEIARIPTVFVFDRTGRATLHFVHLPGAEVRAVDLATLTSAIELALERAPSDVAAAESLGPVNSIDDAVSLGLGFGDVVAQGGDVEDPAAHGD